MERHTYHIIIHTYTGDIYECMVVEQDGKCVAWCLVNLNVHTLFAISRTMYVMWYAWCVE